MSGKTFGSLLSGLIAALISQAIFADILVVSRTNNSVVVFDNSGVYQSTVALPAGNGEPRDIAQAPNGDIFILRSGGQVQRYDASLGFIEEWDSPGQYYGINVDDAGLVYVAGSGSGSGVGIYNASGVPQSNLLPAGGTNLRDTTKVGSDTWVTSFSTNRIDVFNSAGIETGFVTSPPSPFGMQKAPNGDVWVVDQNSHLVWRINPAGAMVDSFNADDGPNGGWSSLWYLGVASNGTLFIPNLNTGIVDVYDDSGTYVSTLTHADIGEAGGVLPTGGFVSEAPVSVPALSAWSTLMLVLLLGMAVLLLTRRKILHMG